MELHVSNQTLLSRNENERVTAKRATGRVAVMLNFPSVSSITLHPTTPACE